MKRKLKSKADLAEKVAKKLITIRKSKSYGDCRAYLAGQAFCWSASREYLEGVKNAWIADLAERLRRAGVRGK